MHGLQGRVGLVLGVARPVLGQGDRVATLDSPHPSGRRAVFVDVVAQEHDEVQLLGQHVAPGGEEAVVPALAARDGKTQGLQRVSGRRGAGAADRAALTQGLEAVPVPAARLQPGRLGMHAVGPGRFGRLRARGDALPERLVLGHFPAHLDTFGQIGAGQPGPQHHAVDTRVGRGNAEGEALRYIGARKAQHAGRKAGGQ